jgi:UDPglucose 6-dehydrogenase
MLERGAHVSLISHNVAVIGSGYVGLTTAACLAHLGHRVICTDIQVDRVEALNAGRIPILEDGMPELVAEGLANGTLAFSTSNGDAVARAGFVFLCLPTPQGDDGHADLSYIVAAAGEIAPHLRSGAIVINKSTVPVNSTTLVESVIQRDDVDVASNPEFLREGKAVSDFLDPDRVVIGTNSERVGEQVKSLYGSLDATVLIMDPVSAEVVKYASNAFLAAKITFANEIAMLCDAVGADVRHVTRGMGHDHRIGSAFLNPGPGWGGSCFPKDTIALVQIAERGGFDFELLRSVIATNDKQSERVLETVISLAGGSVDDKVVAVWGLTFKANTDDLRCSPSLKIIEGLVAAGARVRAYDPAISDPIDDIAVCADPYSACRDAAVAVVLTEWAEFAEIDLDRAGQVMEQRALADARNLIDPDRAALAGFRYRGLGVPTAALEARTAVAGVR